MPRARRMTTDVCSCTFKGKKTTTKRQSGKTKTITRAVGRICSSATFYSDPHEGRAAERRLMLHASARVLSLGHAAQRGGMAR